MASESSTPGPNANGMKPPRNSIDAYKRMNFLMQAAQLYSRENQELSRFYVSEMRNISLKMLIRQDKSVKHQYCPTCETVLIPGETETVRLSSTREKHIILTCTYCGFHKRIPTHTRDPATRRPTATRMGEFVYPLAANPVAEIAASRKKKSSALSLASTGSAAAQQQQSQQANIDGTMSKRAQKRMWAQKKASEEQKKQKEEQQGPAASAPAAPGAAAAPAPAEDKTVSEGKS